MMHKFIVEEKDANVRLDRFLEKNSSQSRSQIKRDIDDKRVSVNGKSVKAGYKLNIDDCIEWTEKEEYKLKPKDLKLDIVYEDDSIAVVNKPKELVVHPGAGEEEETLVHGLLYALNSLSPGSDPLRPGIVHRLDKDTSGLVVVAKTLTAETELIRQFKEREVKKKYKALVYGIVDDELKINAPIGRLPSNRKKMGVHVPHGKEAVTIIHPENYYENMTLLDIDLLTGRTHQIRVHLSSIGHPVVGDPLYMGSHKRLDSQLLHAYYLEFTHPKTGERMSFTAPLPEEFQKFLKGIE